MRCGAGREKQKEWCDAGGERGNLIQQETADLVPKPAFGGGTGVRVPKEGSPCNVENFIPRRVAHTASVSVGAAV